MTYDISWAGLSTRIALLSKTYAPLGDSSFSGVTGNMLSIIGFGEQLPPDSPLSSDIHATRTNLNLYLQWVEKHAFFREKEMTSKQGYFPDLWKNTPMPHSDYVRSVAAVLETAVL